MKLNESILKNLNDRVRPSRLRSFHSYEDNPLAEGLADLYLTGHFGRDGLLCRSCARSER